MSTILRIDSSIFGGNGNSNTLTAELSERLAQQLGNNESEAKIVHRDFSTSPIPHFDAGTVQAVGEGKAELADVLIEEIQAADAVVIGAPMYNFTIPSQLKAWLDHIARARVTFQYGANGPEGLLTGKQVYVVTTRGGAYKDSAADTMVPYLKVMLGFLGLDDNLQFIYAEQLASADHKEGAMDSARSAIKAAVYLEGAEA